MFLRYGNQYFFFGFLQNGFEQNLIKVIIEDFYKILYLRFFMAVTHKFSVIEKQIKKTRVTIKIYKHTILKILFFQRQATSYLD